MTRPPSSPLKVVSEPSSVWRQRWRWATSSAVREQARQEQAQTAFWEFLNACDRTSLEDPSSLNKALKGASSALINTVLPADLTLQGNAFLSTEHFNATDLPRQGLPPLMWAVCRSQWGLVRHLLEHGADPGISVPEPLIQDHLRFLPETCALAMGDQEATITPLAMAVILLDLHWETLHDQDVVAAWSSNPLPIPQAARITDDPIIKTMLKTFIEHGAQWCKPNDDGRVVGSNSCLVRTLHQGSTLQAWSDDDLRRMDLVQRDPENQTLIHNTLDHVHPRRFHPKGQDSNAALCAVPALSRLIDLDVPLNVLNAQGDLPAHQAAHLACFRLLSPELIKQWALDPRWDWDAPNAEGLSGLAYLHKHRERAVQGLVGGQSLVKSIEQVLTDVTQTRIEREAQMLRETMALNNAAEDATMDGKMMYPRESPAVRPRRRL